MEEGKYVWEELKEQQEFKNADQESLNKNISRSITEKN